ncbi:uncharacterized protein [Rhodnius prolixus]|uniref:Putative heme transporter hrg1-b-like protein panstrongylus lignarius n=1 Tax=Rhodnius prolixus TaxID=13249 RepID=A0A4P6D9G8_RHOPR
MNDLRTRCYLVLSVIGIILGFSAGITFTFYDNNLAVLWAFISGAYALMNALLHILHCIDKLEEYYSINMLHNINCFAFISAAIFTAILAWYIFVICYFRKQILPMENSYVIVAVWIFMSAKWASALVGSTYRYIRILSNSGRPLSQV